MDALSFIGVVAAEREARGQWSAQSTKSCEGVVLAQVTPYLELALTSDSNLDFVSLFEIECLDYCRGKSNRQAASPFCNFQMRHPLLMYTRTVAYPARNHNRCVSRLPRYPKPEWTAQ